MAAESESRIRTEPRIWRSWWIPTLVGVLSMIAGVLAIVWPDATLLAVALITGINLALLSAFLIADALADDEREDRTLRIVLGVTGIIGGLVVIRRPGDTLIVLVLALGIWLVMAGILNIVGTVLDRRPGWPLSVFVGLVDIVAGGLILAWPGLGLATLAVLVGIAFLVHGAMLTITGWRLHEFEHRHGASGTRPPPVRPAATT